MKRRAFILFEAMLAVAIFAIGVLALGRCVENCIFAEILKSEDTRARRILQSRLVEIEAGAVPMKDGTVDEELKGMGEGMKLKTLREPLKRKNEKDQDLTNIYRVVLELSWKSGQSAQSRSIEFYNSPRQQ